MKYIKIIFSVMMIWFLLFIIGIFSFYNYIFNKTDADRFNIDNIEARAHIDIPSIVTIESSSDGNIKHSHFIIDTSDTDISEYIVNNRFQKRDDSTFINMGENKWTKWYCELDKSSSRVDIEIHYLNKRSYIELYKSAFLGFVNS